MASSVTVKPNYKTIGRMLHGEFGIEEAIVEAGERVLAQAKATAPVVSGDYQRSLELRVEDHPTRVVVQVVAKIWYAADVERRLSVLAKAVAASGGKPGKKKG